jgi:hypothetical protein
MTEVEIAGVIKKRFPALSRMLKAEYQHSRYDYENKEYIFEFKSRKKAYDPWIIEKEKLDSNLEIAHRKNKDFIYVTEYKGTLYIWNISKLVRDGYDFNFEERIAPSNTEFDAEDQYMKIKIVGYLYEIFCSTIIYRGNLFE